MTYIYSHGGLYGGMVNAETTESSPALRLYFLLEDLFRLLIHPECFSAQVLRGFAYLVNQSPRQTAHTEMKTFDQK